MGLTNDTIGMPEYVTSKGNAISLAGPIAELT
jgi:hypothetical protein